MTLSICNLIPMFQNNVVFSSSRIDVFKEDILGQFDFENKYSETSNNGHLQ